MDSLGCLVKTADLNTTGTIMLLGRRIVAARYRTDTRASLSCDQID